MGNEIQLNKEKNIFLSLCNQRDCDLLMKKIEMTVNDFERITYLTMALGFTDYTQYLNSCYIDFVKKLTEKLNREFDILEEYPSYYLDEEEYAKYQKWIEEFCIHIPVDKQEYYRDKIKENMKSE